MAEVAATLRLAKPTLYRLARSKRELLRACVEAEAERLLDYLHAALSELEGARSGGAFVAGLRAVERYAGDSPGGFALLFEHRGREASQALGRVEARLATLLRGSVGGADHELPRADLLAAALLGASAGIVSRALAQGGGIDGGAVVKGLAAALTGD
jgi:AcrR family transcriptional regulator